jgi:exopolyphosphatase/guanosine-5'-triphosphate,3'-diphosphate pyrophosphatase
MTPKGPAGVETGRRRQIVEGRKDELGAAELRAAEDGCGNGEGLGAPNAIATVASSGSPVETAAAGSSTFKGPPPWPAASKPAYAALDLGTNNCRLLVARPSRRGFKVIDAFSRIIRLGEGVSASGRLSEAAVERTLDALKVCAAKIRRHQVVRSGLIATEACRLAANADEFLERARTETGLDITIVSRETEAKLAVSGCASLIDFGCDFALVFDIGGGSSELIWLDLGRRKHPPRH